MNVFGTSLSGPALNRRTIMWMVPTFVGSLLMGALSGERGPIPQSNPWIVGAFVIMLVTGAIGTTMAAFRKIGSLALDRGQNRLRMVVGETEGLIDLSREFQLREYALPPSTLSPNGARAIVLSQDGATAGFWYATDTPKMRRDGLQMIVEAPIPLRCRRPDIGFQIHEHIRTQVACVTVP